VSYERQEPTENVYPGIHRLRRDHPADGRGWLTNGWIIGSAPVGIYSLVRRSKAPAVSDPPYTKHYQKSLQ